MASDSAPADGGRRRPGRALALATALVVSATLGVAPPTLDAAPIAGTAELDLIFASDRDGGGVLDLWSIDAGGAQQVLDQTGVDTYPRFSPDGSRIAWTKDGGNTTNGRLWVAAADGTGAQVANSFQTRFAPAWSPDGTQIAVIGVTGDSDFDLHLVAADGSGATKLADTAANETNPTWGVFGIALVRGSSIVVVDPTTGADLGSFTVGSGASALDAHPSEPLIAFSQPTVGGRRIVVLDVDTGTVTPLTDGTTYDGAPAWSSDGSAIAFNRRADISDDNDLWVMDADGTNAVAVTTSVDDDVTPDWRPATTTDPSGVQVDPAWGAPGSWTIVAAVADETGACDFPPDTDVDVAWDDIPLTTVRTDGSGCFGAHVFLDPERLGASAPGTHQIEVVAPDGSTGVADFEQVTEELRIRPVVAGPGAPVTVEGCGWTPRSDVVIVWYATGSALGNVGTDELGCLVGSVDLPSVDAGLYPVAAAPAGTKPTGPGGTSATAVEIAPASFVVQPDSGPPGARVAVIGCSWYAGEQVELVWATTGESLGVFDADGAGCLSSDVADPDFGTLANVTIPLGAAEGLHVIRADGLTSGQSHDEEFAVVVPELVFDPASAEPGTIVSASGCGWNGNATVRLTWGAVDPNGSSPAWVAPVDQVTGCFGAGNSFTFEVPDDTRTGEIVVTAEGDERGTASAVFEVVHAGTISAPATAEVGETITVQIAGAIIGESIEISVNGFATAGFANATTTDFSADVTIPLDSYVGDVRLVASGTRGFSAETPITIPNPSRLEVVSPEPIFVGRPFRIEGSGFAPGSYVTIGLSDDPNSFGRLDGVQLDPASTSFTITRTVPEDRVAGPHELAWTSVRGRNGEVIVDVAEPPFDVTAAEAAAPVVDGTIGDEEWDLTSAVTLGGAEVAFQSDDVRLYVLVDVLGDGTADAGDGAALLVDLDGDGAPTPGLDRRFRIESDGTFVVETFNIDGSYAPVASSSSSAGATTVSCSAADNTLVVDPVTELVTCDEHRVYEFGLDLDGIAAAPEETVLLGVEIESATPAIGDVFPTALPANMHGLGRVELAPSAFPLPLPTGTVQGIGVDGFTIEVTQAVQDASNSLPLVADKATAVRVYPDTAGEAVVVVRLAGERDGAPLPGSPLTVAMTVPDVPDRERIEDSANFLLPATWTAAGNVVLRASVADLDGAGTAFASTTVTFQERRVPDIWYVPLNPGTTANPDLISQSRIDRQLSYFETALPLAAVDWTAQPWTVIGAGVPTEINDDGDEVTDLDRANKLLNSYYLDLVAAYATAIAGGGPAPFDVPQFLYGFSPDGGGLADAKWAGGGGISASGFWGTSREGTMAHEINHNLDRSDDGTWGRHVTDDDDDTSNSAWGCAAEGGDPDWPRRAQGDDEIGVIGFDTRLPWHDSSDTDDKTVVPADIADFMSYCQSGYRPTKWISPYRWLRTFLAMAPPTSPLVQSFRAAPSVGAPDVSPADVGPAYYISGEIRVDGTGSLDPVVRQWGVGSERRSAGTHRVVLMDGNGDLVDVVELEPTFVDVEGEARDVVYFQMVVPSAADVARVELVGPGGVLDVVAASPNAPVLDLPVLDGSWTGSRVLSWTASDADGDELTFTVRYSPDGDRWFPVASGLTTPSLTIEGASLVGGTAGRFSVTATDGLNTTSAVTGGAFSVPHQPPTVEIVTPVSTDVSEPGSLVLASGFAHDQYGARIADERLVWLVDGSPIGRGRSVRFRAPAVEYQLDLVVVDAAGQVVSAEGTRVGGPDDLPPSIRSEPATQQTELGDAIVPIVFVADDPDSSELELAITSLPPGVQAGPVTCTPSGDGSECRVVVSGVPTSLGELAVTATAADATTTVTTTAEIDVVPEAATVQLHPGNPVAAAVGETIELSVLVREREPDTASGTPLPGDLGRAEVDIVLEPVSGGAPVPGSECSRRTDDDVLRVTCSFAAVPAGVWSVVATVSGGYTGRAEDVLAVSEADDPDAVTGHGSFTWPGSDDVTRVAFTVDRRGRAVRGGVAVVRTLSDGAAHVLRSNALTGLTTDADRAVAGVDSATVTGKATYLDPAVGEAEGNHRFVLWVSAAPPQGGPARAWIRVVDKRGDVVGAMSLPLPATEHAVDLDGEVSVRLRRR